MSSYRVWCLSWDEDHVDGRDYADKPDSANNFANWASMPADNYENWALDAADAASMHADYCHANRDGWESTWPLTFRVKGPDDVITDFEVDRNMEPTFYARQLQPQKETA